MSASNMNDIPTPEEILKDASRRMDMAIEFLKRDLQSVRTGRASPALVENLTADYYGVSTPLNQMATISAPDAQLITIQPWDRTALQAIEKAIQQSPNGLNPSNDGAIIRVPHSAPQPGAAGGTRQVPRSEGGGRKGSRTQRPPRRSGQAPRTGTQQGDFPGREQARPGPTPEHDQQSRRGDRPVLEVQDRRDADGLAGL